MGSNPILSAISPRACRHCLAGLAAGTEEKIPTRKELETVKVPSWPSIATYREWKTQLTRNVNTAANLFDDSAIAWLLAVFVQETTTFDEFYNCPKEFLTLDRKLAKSLSEIIPKALRDRITNKETAYHNLGQQIKGRQILWMICREFDVNADLGFMYSIEDLSLMPFASDKNLQGFLNKRDEISSCLDMKKIEPAAIAKMFQRKLLTSTIMAPEIQRWRRLAPDHADRSYEWLRNAVETNIRLDREDRNQDNLQQAHRTGTKKTPAAPGKGDNREGKGGDRKKERGKGKGGKSGTSTQGKGTAKGRCYQFYETGSCRYGDKCVFTHYDEDSNTNGKKGKRGKPAAPAAGDEPWEGDEYEGYHKE